MKRKHIITGIVGLVAVYYLRVYNAVKNHITPTAGKMRNFSFKGGSFTWIQELAVSNTSAVSIPVTGADIRVSFGKSEIGTARLYNRAVIRAKGVSAVPVQVEVSVWSLPAAVSELISIINSGNIRVSLAGVISAVGITAPINQEINEKLPFTIKL
jgi:LEA14-like dessication related protein